MAHTPHRRRRTRLAVLLTAAAAAIAITLSIANRDRLTLATAIRQLCDADDARAARAATYVLNRLDEPDAFDALRQRLDQLPDDCLMRTVAQVRAAGRWGPAFGDGWARYQLLQIETAAASERRAAAQQAARIIWRSKPGHDAPAMTRLVRRLTRDGDPAVRTAALPAIAILVKRGGADGELATALAQAIVDADPAVAARARVLSELLTDLPDARPMSPATPDPTDPRLAELKRLESLSTASADIPIPFDAPPLLLIQAVRVSSRATPADLLPVFESDQADLAQLAAVIAIERFDNSRCVDLAKNLLADFSTSQRIAGALLAALSSPDADLLGLLQYRAKANADWATRLAARLAMALHQHPAADAFDPLDALADRSLPRTLVITALLHHGELTGLDWLLAPTAPPPVDLRLALDQLRFVYVLRRYLPDAPLPDPWADADAQAAATERLRLWYLLNRDALRFDPASHTFHSHDPNGHSPLRSPP